MMKVLYLCAVMSVVCFNAYAQHSVTILVKNTEDKEMLEGATVSVLAIQRSVLTDSFGVAVLTDMPDGKYEVTISYVGFKDDQVSVTFPADSGKLIEVFLKGSSSVL